jgi:hypothetical protein
VASDSCQIIPSHGKANALCAVKILDEDGFQGVLAVVDADFWRLEGDGPTSQNLLLTDTHDLETMILKSPSLEKVLDEFGSASKIDRLAQERGGIRDVLLDCGEPMGYLRWVSRRLELSLTFEDVKFGRFVDKDCLSIDILQLVKTVKDKSCRHDLDDEFLMGSIDEVSDPGHDPWDVCCGHDLVGILSHGLGKALGSRPATEVKPKALERALRLGYEYTYFAQTRLYSSIRSWESANQPYKVLPTP